MRRTLVQSIVAPVLSTSLYFVIFGAAIGSRITEIDGVSYGSFIVPGLIMLAILTESISNSSFAIYFPKFTGTIFEILSAPVSFVEILLGFVGAAATKSVIIGAIILVTASFFVDIHMAHPVVMVLFLVLTSIAFSLFNPVVYLVSGFRWSFYENADVHVGLSLGMTITFLVACLLVIRWIFKTGYKLRS
jgi:ABC-2 type transport system permease protein